MNRKEYLIAQGNVQKDVCALAETLNSQLAVFPEAIIVGVELKVIGFKGETLNDLTWFVPEEKMKKFKNSNTPYSPENHKMA